MLENELSFLVTSLPNLEGVRYDEINQHYLTPRPRSVRLRQKGEKFEMTQKMEAVPGDASRKIEHNIVVDKRIYDALRPLSLRSLEKTRYYLDLPDGLTAELDVFHGNLEGLAMVEVEFPDEDSRSAFKAPDWFGRDVSQEEWSSNSYLADKKFEDIKSFLKE